MRHTYRIAAVAACLLLASSEARADCPDLPTKACAHGAVGMQGQCFSFPVCKPCGPGSCPTVPSSFKEMPRRVDVQQCVNGQQRMDGCSNPLPDPLSRSYRELFKAACDQHDLCYAMDQGQKRCDDDVLANWQWICREYYLNRVDSLAKAANAVQYETCRDVVARTWTAAVRTFAGYSDTSRFKSNCLTCQQVSDRDGVSVESCGKADAELCGYFRAAECRTAPSTSALLALCGDLRGRGQQDADRIFREIGCDRFQSAPPPRPATRVTLYRDTQFRGGTLTLTSDHTHLGIPKFGNAASSLRMSGPGPVALYLGAGFSGKCFTVRGDVARFTDAGICNDCIMSVRFNYACEWGGADPEPPLPVGLNMARGKAVRQSSRFGDAVAGRAVDGLRDGRWAVNSVTGTADAPNGWLELDLGASVAIGSVDLYNRTDCCSERLDAATVELRDVPCDAPGSPVLTRTVASPAPRAARFAINPEVRARYLCVRASRLLSLAELEVYPPVPW